MDVDVSASVQYTSDDLLDTEMSITVNSQRDNSSNLSSNGCANKVQGNNGNNGIISGSSPSMSEDMIVKNSKSSDGNDTLLFNDTSITLSQIEQPAQEIIPVVAMESKKKSRSVHTRILVNNGKIKPKQCNHQYKKNTEQLQMDQSNSMDSLLLSTTQESMNIDPVVYELIPYTPVGEVYNVCFDTKYTQRPILDLLPLHALPVHPHYTESTWECADAQDIQPKEHIQSTLLTSTALQACSSFLHAQTKDARVEQLLPVLPVWTDFEPNLVEQKEELEREEKLKLLESLQKNQARLEQVLQHPQYYTEYILNPVKPVSKPVAALRDVPTDQSIDIEEAGYSQTTYSWNQKIQGKIAPVKKSLIQSLDQYTDQRGQKNGLMRMQGYVEAMGQGCRKTVDHKHAEKHVASVSVSMPGFPGLKYLDLGDRVIFEQNMTTSNGVETSVFAILRHFQGDLLVLLDGSIHHGVFEQILQGDERIDFTAWRHLSQVTTQNQMYILRGTVKRKSNEQLHVYNGLLAQCKEHGFSGKKILKEKDLVFDKENEEALLNGDNYSIQATEDGLAGTVVHLLAMYTQRVKDAQDLWKHVVNTKGCICVEKPKVRNQHVCVTCTKRQVFVNVTTCIVNDADVERRRAWLHLLHKREILALQLRTINSARKQQADVLYFDRLRYFTGVLELTLKQRRIESQLDAIDTHIMTQQQDTVDKQMLKFEKACLDTKEAQRRIKQRVHALLATSIVYKWRSFVLKQRAMRTAAVKHSKQLLQRDTIRTWFHLRQKFQSLRTTYSHWKGRRQKLAYKQLRVVYLLKTGRIPTPYPHTCKSIVEDYHCNDFLRCKFGYCACLPGSTRYTPIHVDARAIYTSKQRRDAYQSWKSMFYSLRTGLMKARQRVYFDKKNKNRDIWDQSTLGREQVESKLLLQEYAKNSISAKHTTSILADAMKTWASRTRACRAGIFNGIRVSVVEETSIIELTTENIPIETNTSNSNDTNDETNLYFDFTTLDTTNPRVMPLLTNNTTYNTPVVIQNIPIHMQQLLSIMQPSFYNYQQVCHSQIKLNTLTQTSMLLLLQNNVKVPFQLHCKEVTPPDILYILKQYLEMQKVVTPELQETCCKVGPFETYRNSMHDSKLELNVIQLNISILYHREKLLRGTWDLMKHTVQLNAKAAHFARELQVRKTMQRWKQQYCLSRKLQRVVSISSKYVCSDALMTWRGEAHFRRNRLQCGIAKLRVSACEGAKMHAVALNTDRSLLSRMWHRWVAQKDLKVRVYAKLERMQEIIESKCVLHNLREWAVQTKESTFLASKVVERKTGVVEWLSERSKKGRYIARTQASLRVAKQKVGLVALRMHAVYQRQYTLVHAKYKGKLMRSQWTRWVQAMKLKSHMKQLKQRVYLRGFLQRAVEKRSLQEENAEKLNTLRKQQALRDQVYILRTRAQSSHKADKIHALVNRREVYLRKFFGLWVDTRRKCEEERRRKIEDKALLVLRFKQWRVESTRGKQLRRAEVQEHIAQKREGIEAQKRFTKHRQHVRRIGAYVATKHTDRVLASVLHAWKEQGIQNKYLRSEIFTQWRASSLEQRRVRLADQFDRKLSQRRVQQYFTKLYKMQRADEVLADKLRVQLVKEKQHNIFTWMYLHGMERLKEQNQVDRADVFRVQWLRKHRLRHAVYQWGKNSQDLAIQKLHVETKIAQRKTDLLKHLFQQWVVEAKEKRQGRQLRACVVSIRHTSSQLQTFRLWREYTRNMNLARQHSAYQTQLTQKHCLQEYFRNWRATYAIKAKVQYIQKQTTFHSARRFVRVLVEHVQERKQERRYIEASKEVQVQCKQRHTLHKWRAALPRIRQCKQTLQDAKAMANFSILKYAMETMKCQYIAAQKDKRLKRGVFEKFKQAFIHVKVQEQRALEHQEAHQVGLQVISQQVWRQQQEIVHQRDLTLKKLQIQYTLTNVQKYIAHWRDWTDQQCMRRQEEDRKVELIRKQCRKQLLQSIFQVWEVETQHAAQYQYAIDCCKERQKQRAIQKLREHMHTEKQVKEMHIGNTLRNRVSTRSKIFLAWRHLASTQKTEQDTKGRLFWLSTWRSKMVHDVQWWSRYSSTRARARENARTVKLAYNQRVLHEKFESWHEVTLEQNEQDLKYGIIRQKVALRVLRDAHKTWQNSQRLELEDKARLSMADAFCKRNVIAHQHQFTKVRKLLHERVQLLEHMSIRWDVVRTARGAQRGMKEVMVKVARMKVLSGQYQQKHLQRMRVWCFEAWRESLGYKMESQEHSRQIWEKLLTLSLQRIRREKVHVRKLQRAMNATGVIVNPLCTLEQNSSNSCVQHDHESIPNIHTNSVWPRVGPGLKCRFHHSHHTVSLEVEEQNEKEIRTYSLPGYNVFKLQDVYVASDSRNNNNSTVTTTQEDVTRYIYQLQENNQFTGTIPKAPQCAWIPVEGVCLGGVYTEYTTAYHTKHAQKVLSRRLHGNMESDDTMEHKNTDMTIYCQHAHTPVLHVHDVLSTCAAVTPMNGAFHSLRTLGLKYTEKPKSMLFRTWRAYAHQQAQRRKAATFSAAMRARKGLQSWQAKLQKYTHMEPLLYSCDCSATQTTCMQCVVRIRAKVSQLASSEQQWSLRAAVADQVKNTQM